MIGIRAAHDAPLRGAPVTPAALDGCSWMDWNLPPHSLPGTWPPGNPAANSAGHHVPENPPNGQTGLPVGVGGDEAGVTKRQRIEEYLDRLDSEQLQNLTVREITAHLQGQGLEVTERYVKHVLDQRRPAPRSRRRGSGPRSPRR
jgi:hypothetical protein